MKLKHTSLKDIEQPKYLKTLVLIRLGCAQLLKNGWGSASYTEFIQDAKDGMDDTIVWVELKKDPVAVMVVEKSGYVSLIYVRKPVRCKGLVRRMFEYAFERLGKKTLSWDVSYSNDVAIGAYNRITGQAGPREDYPDYILRKNVYFRRQNSLRPKN